MSGRRVQKIDLRPSLDRRGKKRGGNGERRRRGSGTKEGAICENEGNIAMVVGDIRPWSAAELSTSGSEFCEGVIIRLRCSSFSDDAYIYIVFIGRHAKTTKKIPRAFISERISVIFGTPVGRTICSKYDLRFFFRTTP